MKLFLSLVFILFVLPGFAQEDDEKLLEELEAERKSQMEAAVQLDQNRQQIVEQNYNFAAELEKAGYKTLNAASLLDERVVEILREAISQSNVYEFSHEEIKEILLQNSKGSTLETIYTRFPKTLDIAAGIMGDREALPALLGMAKRRDDLKRYGITAIGIFIIGLILRKMLIKKEWSFFKRLSSSMGLSLLATFINLIYFYILFREEVSPSLRVILEYL